MFLDCGNIERNPAEAFRTGIRRATDPQHRPPPRQHAVRDRQPVEPDASCTAEIVFDLLRAAGVEPTSTIANALYVGLITDTGRFMYQNTGAGAHLMAAG